MGIGLMGIVVHDHLAHPRLLATAQKATTEHTEGLKIVSPCPATIM